MCTNLRMIAQDGSPVVGRTQEFAAPLDSRLVVLPRGHEGVSSGPSGDGLRWTSTYGIVGVNAVGDADLVQDGMNEKGLYGGLLYMPDFCQYTPADGHDPATLLTVGDALAFLLGTCATIDDVKAAMQRVVVWPWELPQWGFAPPLHFAMHDASGASTVIEWRDGECVTFDNPIGVTTNAPHLDWHYTNLRNYVGLSAKNPSSVTIAGVDVAPLGQGTGFFGLPGDTSPASRFVRGAAFVATHVEVADGPALEAAMLHVMNNFDIPKGSVVTTDGSSIEHTQFTSISNLRDLHYVVRTEQNFTPYRIDVKAVDLSPGPVRQLDFPSGDFAELTI